MRSRLLLLSLVATALLAVTVTVAVAMEWWVVASGAGALLVSAALLLAADANRQARMVRRQLRKLGRRLELSQAASEEMLVVDPQTPVQETRADMLGAVRVLQAQYTARLDRLQTSVEDAVEELRRDRGQGAGDHAAD